MLLDFFEDFCWNTWPSTDGHVTPNVGLSSYGWLYFFFGIHPSIQEQGLGINGSGCKRKWICFDNFLDSAVTVAITKATSGFCFFFRVRNIQFCFELIYQWLYRWTTNKQTIGIHTWIQVIDWGEYKIIYSFHSPYSSWIERNRQEV